MDAPKHIPTEHKDIIHDVSFDYYGKRMATCSSDHTVKVTVVLKLFYQKCKDIKNVFEKESRCLYVHFVALFDEGFPLITFFFLSFSKSSILLQRFGIWWKMDNGNALQIGRFDFLSLTLNLYLCQRINLVKTAQRSIRTITFNAILFVALLNNWLDH